MTTFYRTFWRSWSKNSDHTYLAPPDSQKGLRFESNAWGAYIWSNYQEQQSYGDSRKKKKNNSMRGL